MANLDATYDIDHRVSALENHQRGMLVCLAGPGTGKTYSLLARSEALVAGGSDQDSICYLTFIREISHAFIDDYIQRFGAEAYATSAPRISTLHSFACRIIRNQGYRINYDGELFFMNLADRGNESDTFLTDLLPLISRDGCRTVPQLRTVVKAIKRAWQDGVDPAQVAEPVPEVAHLMMEFSRCFRLLDWDQTIPVASELFRQLEEAPQWISRIKHYFVDEYQDFNRAEQALISHLAATADSVVIVGDDDQSLYSARGGSPDGIRMLLAAPENDQVTLVKCYRCKASIVALTNTFQAHMSANARPMTPVSGGGQVMCYRFKSSKAEVAFLAEYFEARIAELPGSPSPKDGIVCLFPSKRILGAYFDMLSPHVPCTRREHDVPNNRQWLERVMRLLVRRRQRFLQRLLLSAYEAIKPRHRSLIVRRVLERDVSPAAAAESLIAETALTGAVLTEAQAFVDLCTYLAEQNLPLVARAVAAELALDEDEVEGQLKRLMDADDSDQSELLDGCCDTLLPDTVVPAPDSHSVMFLTMHGSKGLTRKTVVLPGLEEACLPNGGDPTSLPEKQRLFFVALSRATDNLLLTLPHNRGGADSLNFFMAGRGEPSTFIAAAGLTPQYHE